MRLVISVCILAATGCMGSAKLNRQVAGLDYVEDMPDCDVDADGDIDGDDRDGAPDHCAQDVAFCYMADLEGCQGDGGDDHYSCDEWHARCGGDTPMPEDTAQLRVVHAAPDAPAVDIYAAGSEVPLLTDVTFGETSEYLTVPVGSYDIQIRAAGAAATDEPVYSTGALELARDARVTAVAAGLLATDDEAQRFRVLALAEGFQAATPGTAVVRVVHASADAPAVAIDVGDDGTAELTGLDRFADSGAAGVALPAGQALQIGILAGEPLARVTAFTTPALPDGAEIFVIATGLLGRLPREQDGFALLAVSPAGSVGIVRQNPSVFALHAGPDAPAVDVFAGPTQLVDDLSFGGLAGPVQVPPGQYTLDFFGATDDCGGRPAGHPVASTPTPALEAGERYLVIATGFLAPEGDEPGFHILAYTEAFAQGDENARLRVIHASPDAPRVDLSTVDNGQIALPLLVSGLGFSDATAEDGLSLPAATLPVGVAASGSLDPVATFHVTTAPGLKAFAVAAGALAPEEGEAGFELLAVDTSTFPWTVAAIAPQPR